MQRCEQFYEPVISSACDVLSVNMRMVLKNRVDVAHGGWLTTD